MYVNYNLFPHSLVDGHLGCFKFLVVVNHAVMNMRVKISPHFYLCFIFCKCPLDIIILFVHLLVELMDI